MNSIVVSIRNLDSNWKLMVYYYFDYQNEIVTHCFDTLHVILFLDKGVDWLR